MVYFKSVDQNRDLETAQTARQLLIYLFEFLSTKCKACKILVKLMHSIGPLYLPIFIYKIRAI